MSLPRFVVAGVPKAGTTSLYHYLRAQPGVYVSDVKEINFLSYPGPADAKQEYPWLQFPVTTLDEYADLFAASGERVPVDFSITCFRSRVAVDRIKRFIPDAGLLIVLRDPVSRAWSAYQDRVRKGYERRAPDDALVRGERSVEMGFYSERLAQLRDEFGAARVAVWLFDDLRGDTVGTVREILQHIGASPSQPVLDELRVHNKASLPRSRILHRSFPDHARRRAILRVVPRRALLPIEFLWRANQRPGEAIPQETDARLRNLYADDVVILQEILQRDLSAWLPVERT
jgi:hypothetical protein